MAQEWIKRAVYGGAMALSWVLLLSSGCQSAPRPADEPFEAHRDASVDGLTQAVKAIVPLDPDHPAQLRHCPGGAFEPMPLTDWQMERANTAEHPLLPRHRLDDIVVSVGQPVRLAGHIAYGESHKGQRDAWVRIFLGDCEGWRQVAHRKSDEQGEVVYAMERRLPPGVYGVAIQVAQDATFATASLWVVPRTTPVVLFDLSPQGHRSKGHEGASISSYIAQLTRMYQAEGFLVVYVLPRDQHGQPWSELFSGAVADAPVVGPVFRRSSWRRGSLGGRGGGAPPRAMGDDHPVTLLETSGLEVVHSYRGDEPARHYGFRFFP